MISQGPSSKAVVRCLNKNSCGTGSIVGHHNGGSLAMTNSHVAGDRIGRRVGIDAIVDGRTVRKDAKVIEAMYSDRVIADWALLFIPDWQDIEPVRMTKTRPRVGQSGYTRGCPRCVWPPTDSDINIKNISQTNSVLWWMPDSIGGQSGSAIWDDVENYMFALLTWSWTNQGQRRGAGQMTSEIYKQQAAGRIMGAPKPDGLIIPEPEYNIDWDTEGLTDPNIEGDFYNRISGIQDYPIWHEDVIVVPDPDEPDPQPGDGNKKMAEYLRAKIELDTKWQQIFETGVPDQPDEDGAVDGSLFGL